MLATLLSTLRVLVQVAFRNLFAHRLKTVIIGGIIFFGSCVSVVGSSLLDSIDQSMKKSVVGSVAGDIQVYSSKSKEELAVFGNFGGFPDLTAIDDFSQLKKTLLSVPNVKTVVPMGISGALVTAGNTIDITLARLRTLVNKKLAGDASTELAAEIRAVKDHVHQMARTLRAERENVDKIADAKAIQPEITADLTRGASDEFWAEFDEDPLAALEFLENRIAPQGADSDYLWFNYIGTDMDAFSESFDRMEVVDGTIVPRGVPGFLFTKFMYEETLKLKIARKLDRIREGLDNQGRKIATDAEFQRFIRENKAQVKEIVFQLDSIRSEEMVRRLQRLVGSPKSDLPALLAEFLDVNDANLHARYQQFYDEIVPLVDLYRVRVGDTLTINAITRTGYVQAINVKVYGTFQFKGLEKAALSGVLNLMDLSSFRQLYGFLTTEKAAEIAKIKEESGARDVSRESAEAELFGGGDGKQVVAEATPGVIEEMEELEGTARELRRKDLAARMYSPEELEKGAVLNAAITLHDPSKLHESIQAVGAAAKRDGLPIKAVSWQQAAGFVGQMVLVMRIVLYVAMFIIFVVALIIINNAMVMATLERVREIGTLRAIGAQRGFILSTLLVETAVVGLVFGVLGTVAGSGIVEGLAWWGIPATTDEMYFFFSGPRLRPWLGTTTLTVSLAIVMLVSGLSTFYPAWLAMRVSPVEAMQTEE